VIFPRVHSERLFYFLSPQRTGIFKDYVHLEIFYITEQLFNSNIINVAEVAPPIGIWFHILPTVWHRPAAAANWWVWEDCCFKMK